MIKFVIPKSFYDIICLWLPLQEQVWNMHGMTYDMFPQTRKVVSDKDWKCMLYFLNHNCVIGTSTPSLMKLTKHTKHQKILCFSFIVKISSAKISGSRNLVHLTIHHIHTCLLHFWNMICIAQKKKWMNGHFLPSYFLGNVKGMRCHIDK